MKIFVKVLRSVFDVSFNGHSSEYSDNQVKYENALNTTFYAVKKNKGKIITHSIDTDRDGAINALPHSEWLTEKYELVKLKLVEIED
jgi:hypothetical protein